MKTKIYLLAFVFICSIGSSCLFAYNDGYTRFELQAIDKGNNGGDDAGGGISRSSAIPPIIVFLTPGESIEVFLRYGIGNIDVAIKNNQETAVYQKMVDTSFDDELYIDVANLPASTYTISFTDEAGDKQAYEFVVD